MATRTLRLAAASAVQRAAGSAVAEVVRAAATREAAAAAAVEAAARKAAAGEAPAGEAVAKWVVLRLLSLLVHRVGVVDIFARVVAAAQVVVTQHLRGRGAQRGGGGREGVRRGEAIRHTRGGW